MKKFSKDWKSSKKPRKQRKYQKNAPLHIKSKFLSAHFTKELKKKYNIRNTPLRKGDKIKILRGNFKGKTGKVDRIDLKKAKVYVMGIEIIKKDGTKTLKSLHPSNLVITELNLDDKKRLKRIKGK
jgi:large subunit ribosomal protein L24